MNDNASPNRLSLAGWLAIAVMAAFLGIAIWYAAYTWNRMEGVGISTAGWLFLVLGVVVTFAVGAGLMGLLFYSSRKGRDF
ncbi:MAG TPA: hypothetical protein VH000_13730 [Rhizomicrobium sp.]|jgi:ABC-type multidrug transport system permease subunit|nr:hypothetical protein [Rhizomicrobium sp.]